MEEYSQSKKGMLSVVAVNTVLLSVVALLFIRFSMDYQDRLYEKNLSDIANLNQSSANIASIFLGSQKEALESIVSYHDQYDDTYDGVTTYIGTLRMQNVTFQVIKTDSTGSLLTSEKKRTEKLLDYSSGYPELKKIFEGAAEEKAGNVFLCPEFTNVASGKNSFAFYTYLSLVNADGEESMYTVLSVFESRAFAELLNLSGGYSGRATIITNAAGDYIFGSSDFRSSNFFHFLYVYNDLTLEGEKAIRLEMSGKESGDLFYDSSSGASVFSYTVLPNSEWYCISCVPIASFRNEGANIIYMVLLTISLLALLLIDVAWLYKTNRKLRVSIERERVSGNAKTDFLARMSHDLRTPLNGILGVTNLLAVRDGLPADVRNDLRDVVNAGNYLHNLINDILDMQKIESGKVELHETVVNSDYFFKSILEMLEPMCRENDVEIITDFRSLTPWVQLDEIRSKQVYMNILSNAIKFSPRGSTVEWSAVDTKISDTQYSTISRIVDHGCGMSKEFIPKMYLPFEQEKNPYSNSQNSTGLGIPIVKKIVDLMGGTINVESELGKGTTVTLTFCRSIGAPPDSQTAKEANTDAGILSGKRALYCDDDELNTKIIGRLLASVGCKTETAENGQIGVKMFETAAEKYYDIILMDVRMPVMDGLEAVRTIRELPRSDAATIPIIALSANAYESDIKSSLNAGMNEHLSKPIDSDKLLDTMARFLGAEEINQTKRGE